MMRPIVALVPLATVVSIACQPEPTSPGNGPSSGVGKSDSHGVTVLDSGSRLNIGNVDPPAVTVYDINMVAIDAITVNAGAPFTLIGYVVGNVPLYYYWYRIAGDGTTDLISEGTPYLLDYVINEPGDYVIRLYVIDGNALTGSDQVSVTVLPVETAPVEVEIDIKPGSDPNSINLRSKGNVPVAIFSTPAFDATTIDPATVTLADAPVRAVGRKGERQAAAEDVNGDGLMDLLVHIDTQALVLAPGAVEAVLTGTTYDGTPIRGSDAVQIVP
jgi:hypothetical protein